MNASNPVAGARARLAEHARQWGVAVTEVRETPSSLVAFGRRRDEDVVLKIVKAPGDEWRSGEVASAFGGRGVVRVLEHTAGAALLERLCPGHPLVELVAAGADDEATTILARLIGAMSPTRAPDRCPTVEQWGEGYERYSASGDSRVPASLVKGARRAFAELARSQRVVRLLHGDLQHSNVLVDETRGWIAIDPKGVIGELEFEVGAALRNPWEMSALFAHPETIVRRVRTFVSVLSLDGDRVLGWAFAQAVLSAIWDVEDGVVGDATDASIRLAESIRALGFV